MARVHLLSVDVSRETVIDLIFQGKYFSRISKFAIEANQVLGLVPGHGTDCPSADGPGQSVPAQRVFLNVTY